MQRHLKISLHSCSSAVKSIPHCPAVSIRPPIRVYRKLWRDVQRSSESSTFSCQALKLSRGSQYWQLVDACVRTADTCSAEQRSGALVVTRVPSEAPVTPPVTPPACTACARRIVLAARLEWHGCTATLAIFWLRGRSQN